MESSENRKQCPKCEQGWYMLETIDENGNVTYTCPVCGYVILPEK